MFSTDVAPRDWEACLDSFSRRHAHASATVEIHSPQHGPPDEVFEGRLVGAEVEHSDGHDAIFLAIGGDEAADWSQLIAHPKAVSLFQEVDGSDRMLSVESDDGGYTLIRV